MGSMPPHLECMIKRQVSESGEGSIGGVEVLL